MSPQPKGHQHANFTDTQIQTKKFTKTQMLPKCKCHQNANVTKMQMAKNANVTKTQISQNLNLPNWSCTTRSPLIVYINPSGLPGHVLCDSRLVINMRQNMCHNIWVKMPRKNNGLLDVLNLLFLTDYCGQL